VHGEESLLTADADPVDFRVLIGSRTMPTTPSECAVRNDWAPCVFLDRDGGDAKLVTGLVPASQVAHHALDPERDPFLPGRPVPAIEEDPLGEVVLDGLLHTLIDEMSALAFTHEAMPGLTRQGWQPFEQPPAERVFHADVGRFR
jgi:hypothetical protein